MCFASMSRELETSARLSRLNLDETGHNANRILPASLMADVKITLFSHEFGNHDNGVSSNLERVWEHGTWACCRTRTLLREEGVSSATSLGGGDDNSVTTVLNYCASFMARAVNPQEFVFLRTHKCSISPLARTVLVKCSVIHSNQLDRQHATRQRKEWILNCTYTCTEFATGYSCRICNDSPERCTNESPVGKLAAGDFDATECTVNVRSERKRVGNATTRLVCNERAPRKRDSCAMTGERAKGSLLYILRAGCIGKLLPPVH